MTRLQARKVLRQLSTEIHRASYLKENHIDIEDEDFMDDVKVALEFAIDDMESLQDVINITSTLIED